MVLKVGRKAVQMELMIVEPYTIVSLCWFGLCGGLNRDILIGMQMFPTRFKLPVIFELKVMSFLAQTRNPPPDISWNFGAAECSGLEVQFVVKNG